MFPSLFSRDAALFVTPGGSSLYVAMQIAFFLGIRKFYLYGTDFRFTLQKRRGSGDNWRSATGDGNHFIQNYRSNRGWCPPSIENILPSFLAARQLMESEGGFIRNATRGGALEVFDRIGFDEALEDCVRAGSGEPNAAMPISSSVAGNQGFASPLAAAALTSGMLQTGATAIANVD
jgi:hypothetical protein